MAPPEVKALQVWSARNRAVVTVFGSADTYWLATFKIDPVQHSMTREELTDYLTANGFELEGEITVPLK